VKLSESLDTLAFTQGRTHVPDHRETFAYPDEALHHESQEAITSVTFRQEEDHSHQDGHENQVLDQVSRDELYDGLLPPHVLLQVMGKVQHATLRLPERETHEGGGNEKQKAGLDKLGQLGSQVSHRRHPPPATPEGIPSAAVRTVLSQIRDGFRSRVQKESSLFLVEAQKPVHHHSIRSQDVKHQMLEERLPEALHVVPRNVDVLGCDAQTFG
jgi:hypothetical protein